MHEYRVTLYDLFGHAKRVTAVAVDVAQAARVALARNPGPWLVQAVKEVRTFRE